MKGLVRVKINTLSFAPYNLFHSLTFVLQAMEQLKKLTGGEYVAFNNSV